MIVTQLDVADKRQFDYAVKQTESETSGKKLAIICGSIVVLIGFSAAAYLGTHGEVTIAFIGFPPDYNNPGNFGGQAVSRLMNAALATTRRRRQALPAWARSTSARTTQGYSPA
jgi:hypothetical protein